MGSGRAAGAVRIPAGSDQVIKLWNALYFYGSSDKLVERVGFFLVCTFNETALF
jgi:hypothetical protein